MSDRAKSLTGAINRRNLLRSTAALGALPLLGGAATRALAANTTVNLGCWGGVFEKGLLEMSPGVAENTGVDLALNVGGSQVTLAKLKASPGNPPFDAVMMTAEAMRGAEKEGLLSPVTEAELPNLTRIQPRLLDPFKVDGGYTTIPLHWKAMGILWREDLVPFEITSWKDLWRPELKNRISVQNMPTLGGALMLMTANRINGGTAGDMEPGWEAMKELKPNVREFFSVSSNALASLAAGDTWVTINTLDLGLPMADRGVKATVPVEGVNYSPEGFAIPKGAAEREAALRFINYMLEPEQQITWCSAVHTAPATDVAVPPELASNIVETDAVLEKLFDIDFMEMADNMAAWSDRWRREIAG